MFIPLNSFETWAAFYDWNTERIFLSVKTICEITNMVLFLIYIVILMMKDRRERERIKLLNEQLQKANEQLHEFAQEKELMGETKERNRLAREIHDTLGHILTGISVGIDAVLVLMDIAPDKAKAGRNRRYGKTWASGCPPFGKKVKARCIRANVTEQCDSSDDRGYVKGHEHENLLCFLYGRT